jgi:DNA-directed RNA polymerase specialized sigma24 family protein
MKERSEAILREIDGYVVVQAHRLIDLHMRRRYERADILDVDELAQRSRIKLWKTLEKNNDIVHLYSYVRHIVYSEFIDMQRQQKHFLPLFIEENDLLESSSDPANEFIQRMENVQFFHKVARAVAALPPRQRLAMLCMLRDRVDDIVQLRAIFHLYNIDVDAARWPSEKAERRLLLASLSVARQKLARERKMETSTKRCIEC